MTKNNKKEKGRNLSKEKRQQLLESIEDIRNSIIEPTPDILKKIREISSEIEDKKFGLVFEDYQETIDETINTSIPVLKEIVDKKIAKNLRYNFIIEGDNLASLKILEKTHSGRIGVIYIDPPYNRGKQDFIYDDDYVCDDEYFKHSMWLSFMKKRLEIARNLLSYDGVIFISIDEKEGFNLKMLCDQIFGAENLVSCMPRLTKKSGKSSTTFSKNHDYLLVYVKNNTNIFVREEHIDEGFKHKDEFYEKRGPYKLNQTLDYDTLGYVNSLDFPIEINGKVYYPGSVDKETYLQRKKDNPKDGYRWRWSESLVKFGLENNWIQVNESTNRIYTKTYLNADIDKSGEYKIIYKDRTKAISSIDFVNNEYSNDNARKELDMFAIKDKFDYPKPSSLIKRLVKSYYDKNCIVLDFFAGSGTTGQAVMDLNSEDDGNRTFILCTNNENKICENITYQRVQKVINGFKANKEIETVIYEKKLTPKLIEKGINVAEVEKILGDNKEKYKTLKKEINDNYYQIIGIKDSMITMQGKNESLKYFRVEYLPKEDRTYIDYSDDLLNYCKPLVELQNSIDFESDNNCILILEDYEFDKLLEKISSLSNKRIFIGNNVLVSREQKEIILKKNDLFILPDYFYKE